MVAVVTKQNILFSNVNYSGTICPATYVQYGNLGFSHIIKIFYALHTAFID